MFSFIVSIGIIHILIPYFNTFITSDLCLSDLYAGYTPLVLILLLGTIIIIPPLYVILKINKNSLSEILKNENKQKTILIRNIVITQFTISIILTTTVPDSITPAPESENFFANGMTFASQQIGRAHV